MSVTNALMRRGAELVATHMQSSDKPQQQQPNGGVVALFSITVVLFCFAFWAVEYTYGMVVATLAVVEDTNPDIYVRITPSPDPTKPTNDEDPELVAPTPPKPITSKLRTTVKHLRSRAGYWSRFRGMTMFVGYTVVRGFLSSLIPVPTTSYLGQFIVQSILSVLLATWQMAWVHIVISEPSPKSAYQRIPSYKTWIKIAPAAALQDILTAAAFFIPMAIAKFAGWLDAAGDQDVPPMVAIYRFMGAGVIPALLAFLISMPARVIFVRVAASMLPEEDETIVPFDRSFGGKVSPAITGGSGKIGLMDAWTTFDWAARVRFAKVIGKTFAMEVALGIFAALVLGAQVFWMFKTAKPVNSDAPGFQMSWE
ncbi:hypothetical protein E8E15_003695 [Penicillium rubens]|uniref:Pc22g00510 protein n=2 Tax=Penicillium chrysogenum species complex TaxID=254878 RepID=B6HPG5_PENRW|nr:uncharacterized protein N7525_006129 [Penicillium rubens]KAJ5253549.1 hypothetical protein N7505_012212 [Penicillium chrysogenum]CAP97339.1 Pc22g00510 [Penicillium rubens Wisconsin 54-1255]KAF3029681.1 hypothetical protein E8E15_003695 [Penicillium rubens]KAJ5043262.1 hypothetical protein NUH16_000042 [Penicillium rubens]KAJ5260863.1 hypothetical protein N7524_008496 [Penicillium chrysogenum]